MLHGRWRSRHRVCNIKRQGEDRIKKNKRRAIKNTRVAAVSNHFINELLVNFIIFYNYFNIRKKEEEFKQWII